MIIDDEKILCMQKIIEGKDITEVAKIINRSRTTIYNWQKDKDFINEMNKLKQQTINNAEAKINGKVNLYLDEIEALALNKEINEKTRADLLKYLVNRTLGNTTNKTEVTTNTEEENQKEFNLEEFKLQLVDNS